MRAKITTLGEVRNIINTKNIIGRDEEVDINTRGKKLSKKWKKWRCFIGGHKMHKIISKSLWQLRLENDPKIWILDLIGVSDYNFVLRLSYEHSYFPTIML